jgi:hypothetical protein
VAVNEKRTHFGRGGEYFAMSELLLRGWNVAVPVVDVGDDVFVIDDDRKDTRFRRNANTGVPEASFTLSRAQLRSAYASTTPLVYMFLVRENDKWRFFVIAQEQLAELHNRFVEPPNAGVVVRPKHMKTQRATA